MNTKKAESRKGIISVLVSSGLLLGFVLGGALAVNLWVDKSDGLAGGVMVLFYALLFALLLAIVGGIAGKVLPRPRARLAAWVVAPFGLAVMIFLIWQLTNQLRMLNEFEEEAYASLLPFELQITALRDTKFQLFSYIYSKNMARVRTNGEDCSGPLQGSTRVKILSALRAIEIEKVHCDHCSEELPKVVWQIREALGNVNSGEFNVSEKMLTESPAIRGLMEVATASVEEIGCD